MYFPYELKEGDQYSVLALRVVRGPHPASSTMGQFRLYDKVDSRFLECNLIESASDRTRAILKQANIVFVKKTRSKDARQFPSMPRRNELATITLLLPLLRVRVFSNIMLFGGVSHGDCSPLQHSSVPDIIHASKESSGSPLDRVAIKDLGKLLSVTRTVKFDSQLGRGLTCLQRGFIERDPLERLFFFVRALEAAFEGVRDKDDFARRCNVVFDSNIEFKRIYDVRSTVAHSKALPFLTWKEEDRITLDKQVIEFENLVAEYYRTKLLSPTPPKISSLRSEAESAKRRDKFWGHPALAD